MTKSLAGVDCTLRGSRAVVSPVLMPLIVLGLLAAGGSRAWGQCQAVQSPPTPIPWTCFTTIRSINLNGSPVRDPEGGKSNDSSNGGKSFSAESDLSSGWPQTTAACNPVGPGDTQCGTGATMFFDYNNGGTVWTPAGDPKVPDPVDSNLLDDTLFLRMRVNGDPTAPSNHNLFSNSHWNFLHDYDEDSYKEFWFDVYGNLNILRILFENNNSQSVTNDNACSVAGGTLVTTLPSCTTNIGNTPSGAPCTQSFTRALPVSDVIPGDTSGEWYVDVQIPLYVFKDCTGAQRVSPYSALKFLFSTSDSSQDPIQKDFTPGCSSGTLPLVPCNFSDTTPVTLASFRAQQQGPDLRIDWSTGSELGNVGFNLYGKTASGWERLNERLIGSKVVDSLAPVDYAFSTGRVDATEFAVEDVDVQGRTRWHGGLAPGLENGAKTAFVKLDWPAIAREHQVKGEQRLTTRRHLSAAGVKQARAAGAGTTSWPVFDLRVSADGIYRVTYEALAAAGLDLAGVRASTIGLTNRGSAVPTRVEGNGAKGTEFGPGGFIEFFGQGLDTLYAKTNVYRVVVDAKLARRVGEDKAAPTAKGATVVSYAEKVTVENENGWSFAAPNGDPWYDQWILAYDKAPETRDLPLNVDNLVAGQARISLGLWGVTNWPDAAPDHHVLVALNGSPLGDARFDGLINQPLSFDVPAGVLHEGANTATLTVAGDTGYDWDIVALDSYTVTYPRALVARGGSLRFTAAGDTLRVAGLPSSDVVVYRLSDRGGPVRITGAKTQPSGASFTVTVRGERDAAEYIAAAVGSLPAPAITPAPVVGDLTSGRADYLIITHPNFAGDLAALVAARQAQGLSVKVAETDDIYSSYGYGIFGPEAIRSYVTWAVANLGTKYVLLVGGDTYDYLNRLGAGSMSFVPTFYTQTGPLVSFEPSDGMLGDVDGDRLPDVAIGRLPVRTSAELQAMIAKTLAYPVQSAAGTAVFAADRSSVGAQFTTISDQLIATVPAGWQVQRAFIDDLGVSGAKTTLVGAIDTGVALTHYIGHSDFSRWSFEALFSNSDAAALTNAGRPTLLVQWGCWNSFFVLPSGSSLAEQFLVRGDRGAAAVIGPAGLTSVDADREMGLRLIPLLLQPGMTVGQALTQVKHEVAALNPILTDVTLGVNLLGDPALVVVP
ncbi:MAG: hypothetical protein LAO05_09135 [Acidobacteriia bacterium]|nr:hypothetical protein [Terriglobia bacterium]